MLFKLNPKSIAIFSYMFLMLGSTNVSAWSDVCHQKCPKSIVNGKLECEAMQKAYCGTDILKIEQGIILCNSTEEKIKAAVGIFENQLKRSLGWLTLDAQECMPIYKEDPSKMELVYVYAKGEGRVWSSNLGQGEVFCTPSEEKFDLINPSCQDESSNQFFYTPIRVNGRKLVKYTFR